MILLSVAAPSSDSEGLEMAPGEVCRAPCVEPFVGRGHELRCPADNTQPDRPPKKGLRKPGFGEGSNYDHRLFRGLSYSLLRSDELRGSEHECAARD